MAIRLPNFNNGRKQVRLQFVYSTPRRELRRSQAPNLRTFEFHSERQILSGTDLHTETDIQRLASGRQNVHSSATAFEPELHGFPWLFRQKTYRIFSRTRSQKSSFRLHKQTN